MFTRSLLNSKRTFGLCGCVRSNECSSQLLYASPAWSGFIKADEKAKLQSILNKTVRYGFLANYKPLEYLFESSDATLFSAILRRPGHVLHPLLPPLKTTGYHLRKHSHGLKLSPVQSSLLRKNFIYRMLYTDIYWICLFSDTVYFWICYIPFYYYFCILTSIL